MHSSKWTHYEWMHHWNEKRDCPLGYPSLPFPSPPSLTPSIPPSPRPSLPSFSFPFLPSFIVPLPPPFSPSFPHCSFFVALLNFSLSMFQFLSAHCQCLTSNRPKAPKKKKSRRRKLGLWEMDRSALWVQAFGWFGLATASSSLHISSLHLLRKEWEGSYIYLSLTILAAISQDIKVNMRTTKECSCLCEPLCVHLVPLNERIAQRQRGPRNVSVYPGRKMDRESPATILDGFNIGS